MTSIERRTSGQPSYNGLTEAQFRLALAGYLLIAAAAAFATFIFAPIGLIVIAVVSFSIGYFCRSEKRLKIISGRMSMFELDISFNAFLAGFGSMSLAYAYMTEAPALSYHLLI